MSICFKMHIITFSRCIYLWNNLQRMKSSIVVHNIQLFPMNSSTVLHLVCLVLYSSIVIASAFIHTRPNNSPRHQHYVVHTSASPNSRGCHENSDINYLIASQHRRSLVMGPIVASVIGITLSSSADSASAADGNLNQIVAQLKESSKMMDDIPELIKAEKWDAGEYFILFKAYFALLLLPLPELTPVHVQ